MKIVVASDSFKGSLSAVEVCDAVEKGIKKALPDADIVKLPMSDGGEGLVDVMVSATKGAIVTETVKDPLGRDIEGHYGILGDGVTAVIEMAAASGLPLLTKQERNPLKTTTYGTGQLIKSALGRGVEKIVVGIGGSATVDGGVGMAMALGVAFLDRDGKSIGYGGGEIEKIETIKMEGRIPRIKNVSIDVACDVNNPLTGEHGAARVYGPQKGATPEMVVILEKNLKKLACMIKKDVKKDVVNEPGSGAAGGLGAGLIAFAGGTLKLGIDLVLENTGFDEQVKDADLVITGEGKIDSQTLFGKVPVGVALRAQRFGCPVIAVGGMLEDDLSELHEKNIFSYFSIISTILPEEEIFRLSGEMITNTAEQIIRTIRLGGKI